MSRPVVCRLRWSKSSYATGSSHSALRLGAKGTGCCLVEELGAEEEPVRDVFVVWASFLEWDGAACLRHPDGGRIDAFFHMLHARLLSLESAIVARVPQLDGMIQSFNAMVTRVESAIAGHPIDDLSGKV